jgi:hypothetical protein
MTNYKNNLNYEVDKIIGDEHIFVKIRLNDKCRNGHEDFAITADIYSDKYWLIGCCCHDEILEAFPEFKIFVDLHLSDADGVPMHAVANGYYHLKNGFNNCKPDDDNFAKEYCKYYRMPKEKFDILKKAYSETHFSMCLKELNIQMLWKMQANEAIVYLEKLIGDKFTKFKSTATRSNLHFPGDEEIKAEKERIENGYYSAREIKKREKEKLNAKIKDLEDSHLATVKKLKIQLGIEKQLIKLGDRYRDNCIVYNHSKEIGINWRAYGESLTEKEIKYLKKKITPPKGWSWQLKK